MSTSGWAASTDEDTGGSPNVLRLAAGLTDAPSRMTAIGLSSLADAEPSDLAIDTTWIRTEDEALDRLQAEDVELVLLPIDKIAPDALDRHPDLRAVMKYWRSGGVAEGGAEGIPPAHLLLAKASLSAERVETLLDMTLQDHVVLEAARIDVAKLTPKDALTAFPIAAHDGVQSYLEREGGAVTPPTPAARPVAYVRGTGRDGQGPKPGYTRADILSARLDLQARN
ncbi:MAG: hypothetical protein AAF543_11010, partial [Pseudomonadota bacterium]